MIDEDENTHTYNTHTPTLRALPAKAMSLALFNKGHEVYSVLQCVAVYCSVLQCVEECCNVLQCLAMCCNALQCIAMCCNFDVVMSLAFVNNGLEVRGVCLIQ